HARRGRPAEGLRNAGGNSGLTDHDPAVGAHASGIASVSLPAQKAETLEETLGAGSCGCGSVYIIDVVRGTSGKFDPQSVTEEYAKLCRQYRIRSVTGDNYARDWVAGAWRKLEFEYIRSSRPKGAIYLESLPVFTRGLARLPNHAP